MLVVYLIQKYYLRTSRQMRFLDLEAKSPLYTHFTETMSGLSTIRALEWQPAFKEENFARLDASQRPYYLLFCIQRWLNLILDLFVAGIAMILVTMAVKLENTTTSGSVGLALVNIVNFSQSLSQLISSWTTLETSLGAIARLKSFVKETPSEDSTLQTRTAPAGWPSAGLVQIHIDSASYGYVSCIDRSMVQVTDFQKTWIAPSAAKRSFRRCQRRESGDLREDREVSIHSPS